MVSIWKGLLSIEKGWFNKKEFKKEVYNYTSKISLSKFIYRSIFLQLRMHLFLLAISLLVLFVNGLGDSKTCGRECQRETLACSMKCRENHLSHRRKFFKCSRQCKIDNTKCEEECTCTNLCSKEIRACDLGCSKYLFTFSWDREECFKECIHEDKYCNDYCEKM